MSDRNGRYSSLLEHLSSLHIVNDSGSVTVASLAVPFSDGYRPGETDFGPVHEGLVIFNSQTEDGRFNALEVVSNPDGSRDVKSVALDPEFVHSEVREIIRSQAASNRNGGGSDGFDIFSKSEKLFDAVSEITGGSISVHDVRRHSFDEFGTSVWYSVVEAKQRENVKKKDAAWQTDLLVNGEPFVGAYSNDGSGHEFVAYGRPEGDRFKGVRFFRDGKAELVRVGKNFLAKLESFRITDRNKVRQLVKSADAAVRQFVEKGISAVRTLDEMDRAFTKAVVDKVVSSGKNAVPAAVNAVRSAVQRSDFDLVAGPDKKFISRLTVLNTLGRQMKDLRDAAARSRENGLSGGNVLPMFVRNAEYDEASGRDYFEYPRICMIENENAKGVIPTGMTQLSAMAACSRFDSGDSFFVLSSGQDKSAEVNFDVSTVSNLSYSGGISDDSKVKVHTLHKHKGDEGDFSKKIKDAVSFRRNVSAAAAGYDSFIDGTDPRLSWIQYTARCLTAARLGVPFKTNNSQKARYREAFLSKANFFLNRNHPEKPDLGGFYRTFDTDLKKECDKVYKEFSHSLVSLKKAERDRRKQVSMFNSAIAAAGRQRKAGRDLSVEAGSGFDAGW